MRPLRVLVAHDRYPPEIRGGGEIVVQETVRELVRRGHQVRVITTGRPDLAQPDPGYSVRRLAIHPYRMNLSRGAIAQELQQADLVHAFNYHACVPSFLAARQMGKPVVCTVLGQFGAVWRELRGPLLGRLWQAWERWQIGLPYDRIAFLSAFSRDEALAWGVRRERTLITSPGIEHALYEPREPKQDCALFVGKFEVRKGVDEVVALARALPGLPVRMVGWGPMEAQLRALRDLPNLTIVPFVSGAALQAEFARATMFVFPSRAETFGIVIAEAMAAGCVVVSSVPLPFAGATIPAGDADALIRAVSGLWAQPQAMAAMGRENMERARQFSYARVAEQLETVYRELLAARAGSAGDAGRHAADGPVP